MDGVDVSEGVEAAGDAALVGDDQDEQAGAGESGDSFSDAGQGMGIGGGADVAPLRHFFVENSVAVEKDDARASREPAAWMLGHAAMIATGQQDSGVGACGFMGRTAMRVRTA